MKKFVVCLIIIIFVILFGILFFNAYKSNKYSSENLYTLVQKGIENMHDMQNVYIERENEFGVVEFFYKGNKVKSLPEEKTDSILSYSITNLDEGMLYMVSDKEKRIMMRKENYINKGFQYEVFERIDIKGTNLSRELSYIKDEKINGKDCVFVKEVTYYKAEDGTFIADSELEEDVRSYWIEKSTGFVLGGAMIEPAQTSATPEVWIRNITFDVVKDSDFDLPTDYEIYDITEYDVTK